jgi:nucleotidyltransferase substrate binding protein (TIGR01987 family)
MVGMANDERYQQRFENFSRVIKLLATNLSKKELNDYNDLEQEGLIVRFDLAFELMWKLLRDYLVFEDVEIGLISPKNVLRVAASSGLLTEIGADGDVLLAAHNARNVLTHVYDFENFQWLLTEIQSKYVPEMMKVERYFEG